MAKLFATRRATEVSVSFDDTAEAADSDAADDRSPSRHSDASASHLEGNAATPLSALGQSDDDAAAETSPGRRVSRRESIASEYSAPDEALEAKVTAERVNVSRLRAEAESRDAALARREAFRMIWNRENAPFAPPAADEPEPRPSRREASPDVSDAPAKLRARLERLERKLAGLDAPDRTAARAEEEVPGSRSQRAAQHHSSSGWPRVASNSGFADPVELTLLRAQLRERDAHIQALTRWNATLKAHAEAHVRSENQSAKRTMHDAAASARRAADYVESIRNVFAMEAEHDARASKQCVLLSMLFDKDQHAALRLALPNTDGEIVQPIVWPTQPPSLAVFDVLS